MRTKNSCRFEAYYKIEQYNDKLCVWVPIQKAYANLELAKCNQALQSNNQTRIIKITMKSKEIIKDHKL